MKPRPPLGRPGAVHAALDAMSANMAAHSGAADDVPPAYVHAPSK